MSFIVELITASVIEPLLKFFASRKSFLKKLAWRKPQFDVIDNLVNLIHVQALILFGSFFCPLLPLLAVFRYMVMMKYKSYIAINVCTVQKAFQVLARWNFTGSVLSYRPHYNTQQHASQPEGHNLIRDKFLLCI